MKTHSASLLESSGYETDQCSPSVARVRPGPSGRSDADRKMSSLLQPPPAPMEGSQRKHDKVASFLQDTFMEDTLDWIEFSRGRAHVGSLSNAALLSAYWFAQGRLETWVGSRLPKHQNNMKMENVSCLGPYGCLYHTTTVVGSKLFVFGGQIGTKIINDMWTLDLNSCTFAYCCPEPI